MQGRRSSYAKQEKFAASETGAFMILLIHNSGFIRIEKCSDKSCGCIYKPKTVLSKCTNN